MINFLATLTFLVQSTMTATYYHPSLAGNNMACYRNDPYVPSDPTIAAISTMPCGTILLVEGPNGAIQVTVRDRCPGCAARNMIDLSEAGVLQVCGGTHSCTVQVTRL